MRENREWWEGVLRPPGGRLRHEGAPRAGIDRGELIRDRAVDAGLKPTALGVASELRSRHTHPRRFKPCIRDFPSPVCCEGGASAAHSHHTVSFARETLRCPSASMES